MSKSARLASAAMVVMLVGLLCAGGCSTVQDFLKTDMYRLLAPEKLVRPPTGTPINPIYGSIGPADTSQELVPNATAPREGDWEYTDEEYVIGPTDVVDISILDLFQIGLETVLRREVSASGFIDLPLLPDRIKAEGRTKEQLKTEVIRAYSASVLIDPTVSVTVAGRRQTLFSIIGAVARPGQYPIVRKDMRLLEALAMAGDVSQVNIRYLYVIRPTPAIRVAVSESKPSTPGEAAPEDLPGLPSEPPLAPQPLVPPQPTQPEIPGVPGETSIDDVDAAMQQLGTALPGPQPEPEAEPEQEIPAPSAVPMLAETDTSPTGSRSVGAVDKQVERAEAARTHKWVYTADGKWVRVAQEAPPVTEPSGAGAPQVRPVGPEPPAAKPPEPDPFGWRKLDKSELARIIAINHAKLKAGDQRMNIIVRNSDIIHIPTLQFGECYVMGEVLRPGPISLTGKRMTIKMAMATSGNLGPLAWPANSVLIRRIADHQEQTIPLNIDAIFKGEEPDMFLKTNDVIAVGTHSASMFMAVIRNSFRMTYGFGFIYDRNFADPYFITLNSKRFKRW